MSESPYLIRKFSLPSTSANGPAFSCPHCGQSIASYEWSRDHDATGANVLALRCACGRRYRWTRGAPAIETVFTRWTRAHMNGVTCEVMLEPHGWYSYGLHEAESTADMRWLGETRLLQQAHLLADDAVPPHECCCPRWCGHP